MGSLIKFAVFVCGCAAIYGLATGQDLNELFSNLSAELLPAIQTIISETWQFVLSALKEK